jgi:hypothetical protein
MSEHAVEPQCVIEDGQVACSHCGNIYDTSGNCLPGATLRDAGTFISRCYCPVCRLPEVVVR